MTIANTTVKQIYAGNGVTTTFAIPFDFQSSTEIQVYLRDENVGPATETLLVISTNYTLTGSPAANVEMNIAPIVGESLLIIRLTSLTQPVDYLETGSFPAESHENALDRLTQQTQELNEELDRAFKVKKSSSFTNTDFPDPVPNYLLGWNGAGDELESISPATLTLIGVGDVIGPASATNNAFARYDSVTGKLIKDGLVKATDAGVLSGATQINIDNLRLDGNDITSTNLNGNINITPSGTGDVVLDGLKWPQADGANGTFLTTNGTGQLSFSSGAAGDVNGPMSSTDNALPRFDGVNGSDIQNSGVIVDDSNNVSGINQLQSGNIRISGNDIVSLNAAGNINITPNTTGDLILDGLKFPQADGSVGQALHTNGSGQLYFDTALTGDVVGPAVAVDNEIPRYDGITGKLVQGSGVTISDTQVLDGVEQAFIGELELANSYITPSTPGDTLDLLGNAPTSYVRIEGVRWPKLDGASGQVLTTNGAGFSSWSTPAGGGDVLGPAGATDNAITRYDGASGTLLQDSLVIINDLGAISGATQLNVDNIQLDGNSITSTEVNGDLILTPNGTGDLVLDGVNWPQADGTVNQVLSTDGAGQLAWVAASSGSGDVVGPAASTDNALVRYDGITGKLIQNSGIIIDDSDNILFPAQISTPKQDVASAATIAQLSSLKTFYRITGATATDIQGILAGSDGQQILIHNSASEIVTFSHEDAGAVAADRIKLANGDNLELEPDSSVEFIYDITQSRWVIKSGAGGTVVGKSEIPVGVVNGANTSFTLSEVPTNDESLIFFVDGVQLNINEWSIVTTAVTLSVAPAIGQSVSVFYVSKGAPVQNLPASGDYNVDYPVLIAGDITAKQITLAATPSNPLKVTLDIIGGGSQIYGVDFSVSGNILTWNGLGLDGQLNAGDTLRVVYFS